LFSLNPRRYLNLIPYNPQKFFANWNLQFYKNHQYEDIATLDSAVNSPTQFVVTRQVIIETSQRLNRKINLVITAVGTGSIVDIIEKNVDELCQYIDSITLTDIRDIDLKRWQGINLSEIVLKKQIGNILSSSFIETLKADMFYGNELFGDIPNRFIYKKNNKLYNFRMKIYSKNRLPISLEKKMKEILSGIYFKNRFPKTFTPELGKILSFEPVFKSRIFNRELEYFYEGYPDNSIIAIADSAYEVLFYLYQQLTKKGTILFHDYGFFLPENPHLIQNFLREDNQNNPFVRNYYGEFTTDSSFDFLFYKLKNYVTAISIRKTADRVSEVTGIPKELVNLDGGERDAAFFIEMINERLDVWKIGRTINIVKIVFEYTESLKSETAEVDKTVEEINNALSNGLSEDQKLSVKKILLGYFNEDDHRFLTIEINK
jgi:hypothetical protein